MPKNRLRVERLSRKDEKATIKRIVYLSVVSFIIAVFLFTLGIPLLGKFADLLGIVFKPKTSEITIGQSTPTPPRLDSVIEATNSAKLAISGFTDLETSVLIFLNSENIGRAEVSDGKFKFEDITLKEGKNEIAAKAVSKSGVESDFSEVKTIVLDKEAPNLIVDGPNDDQSFSGNNRVKVFGKTDKDAQVFANGFLASIDLEGNFEVFVPLQEGENNIEIKAVDLAGNNTQQTRKVHYKQ